MKESINNKKIVLSEELIKMIIGKDKAISNGMNAFWTIHGFIGVEHCITVLTEPERNINALRIMIVGR